MVLMGLKRIFRYPWGLLMSLVIDPIVLVLNIFLYRSIYAHSGSETLAGYARDQMIWYFAATSFIWYWIWNFTDRNMSQRVLSGDLSLDLIRPLSVFSLELSRAVSLRVSGVIFEFIPTLVIYAIVLERPFMGADTIFRFCLSASLAFLLFFALNFLIGLAANWIQNNAALSALKFVIVAGLGGSFIPLELFPRRAADVLRILPFSSLFYWPIKSFLGQGGTWPAFWARIGATSAWIALILAIDALIWRRAVRRYSGAGG
jgi:ABC-2 type transport system permease protein